MTVKIKEETTSKTMAPSQKQEVAGVESTHPGPVFTPPVDILETDAAIVIYADMPGVSTEKLSIDLRDSMLTIEGRVEPHEEADRILLREYEPGSYYRQFRLANTIDQSRIDASLTDGVLKLQLPKAESARPRSIQVRAS